MKNLKANRSIHLKAGFLLLATILLFSCNSNTFNSKEELLEFINSENNGYLQKKTINGVDFSLLYKPTDLLVLQELGDDRSTERIDSLRKKYKDYMYFNLSMSVNNKELLSVAPNNSNEFGAMVNQLAFGMEQKIHLVTQKKDSITLADYIYPRTYGISNSTTMMFVYPKDKETLEGDFLHFVIEDLGLQTGDVKFQILNKKLSNQPKLLFKQEYE